MVFVLLGVDATLGDGCRIREHLHSFRGVKCLQGYFKTISILSYHDDPVVVMTAGFQSSHQSSMFKEL